MGIFPLSQLPVTNYQQVTFVFSYLSSGDGDDDDGDVLALMLIEG